MSWDLRWPTCTILLLYTHSCSADLLGLVEHICGTFDVTVFKIILGLTSALVSKCPVTLTHLVIEWNRLKFNWDSCATCNTYMGYHDSAFTWNRGKLVQIYKCYLLLTSSRTPRLLDLLFPLPSVHFTLT